MRCRVAIVKDDCAGAVGAQHIGQHLELLALLAPVLDEVIDAEDGKSKKKSCPERQRHDRAELVAQRQPRKSTGEQIHRASPSVTGRPNW